MKKCEKCNKLVDDDDIFCSYCGNNSFTNETDPSAGQTQNTQQNTNTGYYQQRPASNYTYPPNYHIYEGNPYRINVGLVILSIFCPVAGLIIWLSERKDRPRNAKACLKASLIVIGIEAILCILLALSVLGVLTISSNSNSDEAVTLPEMSVGYDIAYE